MSTTYKTLEESVDELIQAAPDVFAALTPEGVGVQEYFSRFLSRLHQYTYVDVSTIAEATVNAKEYLNFIKAHPELHSLMLITYHLDESEKLAEEQRIEAIKRKYPELASVMEDSSHRIWKPACPIFKDPNHIGLWNPLELLVLTKGDLSFYSGLDKGLEGSDMFLYMEHSGIASGISSNGEVLIGVRPYGKRKATIKPFLQNLQHGSMIAFYEVAQAMVNGKKVGVIESMQTDLLRRDLRGKPLVPNNERRFYTSEKNHWLRYTLPKLESALREAGAEFVLVATMEITMQRYNPIFKNSLSNSISAAQLYEMPSELGYHTKILNIDFLRNKTKTIQGNYWIKPLN